jgi:chemotaxis protein MotB
MKKIGLFLLAAGLAAGCVSKKHYQKSQSDLNRTRAELAAARGELGATKTSLAELQGLKPELEARGAELRAKDEALELATRELQEAKARLAELDQAQREMEESLKTEIDDKTIRIQKLRDSLKVTFVDKILFDSGSDVIKTNGRKSLKKVAESLKQMHGHDIQVRGHTDDRPLGASIRKKFPTNWELSTARATSVVRFLQDEGGLEPGRLLAVGRAFYDPVAANDTEAGRSQNRRVEIILTPVKKEAAPE